MPPSRRLASLVSCPLLALACAAPAASSSAADAAAPADPARQRAHFRAEAWADNWFAAYIGDARVGQDSVPITTERSFNAETFEFDADYPFVLSFVLKDYMQDESGLEYIGTARQQRGDGGFIFQLEDTTHGRRALVSSASWRCKVIQRAPLNPSCVADPVPLQTCRSAREEEPEGWRADGYDDSGWTHASEHSAAAVGPKEGYETVTWDPAARFVWGADLFTDNVVLCRAVVQAP